MTGPRVRRTPQTPIELAREGSRSEVVGGCTCNKFGYCRSGNGKAVYCAMHRDAQVVRAPRPYTRRATPGRDMRHVLVDGKLDGPDEPGAPSRA